MQAPFSCIDKHRLGGLQDGVYSIAITLLVLELRLPELGEPLSDVALWAALAAIWPKILTWLVSFWVLAVFWIGDVRTLSGLDRVSPVLLRIALSRLALVSLLPFTTHVMGEYGHHVPAAAVYSGHLLALALTQATRHAHIAASPAAARSTDAIALANARVHALATVACTALAFGLAFVVPGYNMLALLPLALLPVQRRRDPPVA